MRLPGEMRARDSPLPASTRRSASSGASLGRRGPGNKSFLAAFISIAVLTWILLLWRVAAGDPNTAAKPSFPTTTAASDTNKRGTSTPASSVTTPSSSSSSSSFSSASHDARAPQTATPAPAGHPCSGGPAPASAGCDAPSVVLSSRACDHVRCPWECGACASYGGPARRLPADLREPTAAAALPPLAHDAAVDPTLLRRRRAASGGGSIDDFVSERKGLWSAASREGLCRLPVSPHEPGDLLKKIAKKRRRKDEGGSAAAPSPRVMCMVYTMGANHATKVAAQAATWGAECDGFVAMSDTWDPELPAVGIVHEGKEEWDNMWQKARAIWAYAHERYASEYDYFVIGGDDMYVNVDHLRKYLREAHPGGGRDEHAYVGRHLMDPKIKVPFNAGGAGYTLSRRTLQLLFSQLDAPSCSPHGRFFWEDVQVATCLAKGSAAAGSAAGPLLPEDTRDAEGAERFHPVSPRHLMHIPPSNWLHFMSRGFREGAPGVSKESVSFHYLTPKDMRELHVLYSFC